MKLYSEYTLEELLGFVRAGEGCEGLYDAIAEKVATLRSQHSRDEAVVEAAKRQADDPMVGCPFCGHTTQAGHDEDCVLLPALSAREEAGQ